MRIVKHTKKPFQNMFRHFSLIVATTICLLTLACKSKANDVIVDAGRLVLTSGSIGTFVLDLQDPSANVGTPLDSTIKITFSSPLDTNTAKAALALTTTEGLAVPTAMSFSADASQVIVRQNTMPTEGQGYQLKVSNLLKGAKKETFAGATLGYKTLVKPQVLDSLLVNGKKILPGSLAIDISLTGLEIKLFFAKALKTSSVNTTNIALAGPKTIPLTITTSPDTKIVTAKATAGLDYLTRYTLTINDQLKGALNETYLGLQQPLVTVIDTTDKFPRISDDELLTLVQRQTFKYLWDAADANSGLAQERNASPNVVTTGGSGFGVMTLIVGVDRGFITRQQAVQRWDKITKFLKQADRFHGAWPHWMNSAGRVIPFSPNDDGGDLVETAFMAQGLMTVRQFLNRSDVAEAPVAARIDTLLDGIEWDWYQRGGQDVLYWHWSPRVAWQMNFPLHGWNETMITYVMAAASRTHTIKKSVYDNGFCTSDRYTNGRSYYGIQLPLGPDQGKGGPLFFTHYSFLGLNPSNLRDSRASYFTQNLAHTQIVYQYCVENPRGYPLYGPNCWGLTASDIYKGYTASDPDNDGGNIAPTAALGCMPYSPAASMRALRFFYYKMGNKLWGPQGFYDAFNPSTGWVADSYLAIDQGPIIIMLENYRTRRLWNLFMSSPEVQQGLTKLGFTY